MSNTTNQRPRTKKLTQLEFDDRIMKLVGSEYTFLEPYVVGNIKIKVIHNICQHEYYIRPENFFAGARCPKCYGNALKTTEKFKKEIFEKYGNEYVILEEYVNCKTKINILHTKCNTIFCINPDEILKGKGCSKCKGGVRSNTDEFKNKVFSLVADSYIVMGEYVNNHSKIKMLHKDCEKEYETTPDIFLSGCRCPKCQHRSYLKTTEEFKAEVQNLDPDYELIGEYKQALTKVKILHKKCGRIFEMTPANFITGQRCSKCRAPTGEKYIEKILIENNIEYQTQYKFKDLKRINHLKFDFAIFKQGNLYCLLEYDGQYHYKDSNKSERLKKVYPLNALRDNLKNEYCKKNNIKLIRIPYFEKDQAEEIITREIQ